MLSREAKAFLIVAECGSFSSAAEKLFITPTAVMNLVNKLEARLDLKLFDRTRRGISLTPAGQSLFKDIKKLEKMSNSMLAKAYNLQHSVYNTDHDLYDDIVF